MKPFKTQLRGQDYTVEACKIEGVCDSPGNTGPKFLTIDPPAKGREQLRIILHEALHACYWDLSEDAVHEGSRDIAALLWKMGYRLIAGR